MLLYLAGLQAIPGHLYEAADIDGASGWQKFTNITLPLLGPTNFFVIIMGIIVGFQSFAEMHVMTEGGPDNATKTIVYYIYEKAFKAADLDMGYAAAIAIFLFFMMMMTTLIQWRIGKGQSHY